MEKKIVDYEIVRNGDIQTFKDNIDKMIKQEYQPYKGLVIHNYVYYQIMVKYAS